MIKWEIFQRVWMQVGKGRFGKNGDILGRKERLPSHL
jgi:hypothetical protein